jgi:hypothetical protein
MFETRAKRQAPAQRINGKKMRSQVVVECPADCKEIVLPSGGSLPRDFLLSMHGENGKINTGRKLRITKKMTIQTI